MRHYIQKQYKEWEQDQSYRALLIKTTGASVGFCLSLLFGYLTVLHFVDYVFLTVWGLAFLICIGTILSRVRTLKRLMFELQYENQMPSDDVFVKVRKNLDLTFPLAPAGDKEWYWRRYKMGYSVDQSLKAALEMALLIEFDLTYQAIQLVLEKSDY